MNYTELLEMKSAILEKTLIGWFRSRLEPAKVRTSELGDILKSMQNGIQRYKEAENMKRN